MNTKFSRRLPAVVMVAVVILSLAGCEDAGVDAPSDGSLVISPETADIVIPADATEGSATFTATVFDSEGAPLDGVNVEFTATAGDWDHAQVATDNVGEAEATLTLSIADPDEVDVQASSDTLYADATVFKSQADNVQPIAVIAALPNGEQQAGSVVTFDGSGSVDNDGEIHCYQWTIDSTYDPDDEVVQGEAASLLLKTYSEEQSLLVILRVSDDPAVGAVCDDAGVIASDQFSPYLAALDYTITCDNTAPTAEAGIDVTAALVAGVVTVTLNGIGSFDPDGAIEDFLWDCGNGETAQPNGLPMQAECEYNVANSYIAELRVWDDGVDGVTIDPRTGELMCQKSSTDTLVVTVIQP